MYNILIVEDSKPILRDIERLIRENLKETEIETAYDGEEALEIIQHLEPDILFTDIKMPLMDGLSLIEKAKQAYPSVKCVIISGYTDFSFTHEALRLQVDDYVMKPVDECEFRCLLLRLTDEIDRLRVCRTEAALHQILQEENLVPKGFLPEIYVLALVRVGLFQQYAAPLSRELLNEVTKEIKVSRIWIVNTKLNSEKLIVYDMKEGKSEERIRFWNKKILERLKKEYTRVNIICSEELDNIGDLGIQYTELSNQLGRRVLLDEANVFRINDGAENHKKYIHQREEMDFFRRKMGKVLKNRSSEEYRKEIARSVEKWRKMHYPVYTLRKFLTDLLDEMLLTEAGKQGLQKNRGHWRTGC